MSDYLTHDQKCMDKVLTDTVKITMKLLPGINNRAAGIVQPSTFSTLPTNRDWVDFEDVLSLFKNRYEPWIRGSAEPTRSNSLVSSMPG